MRLLTYSLFVPTDHLTKADLRRLCRKWGLPVSRKSTKMEMLHAYVVWAEREAEKNQMTKYPSDEEGDYSNEEDDDSDEERDPVRAEWLRARERWVEELDEFLERAEATSLLAREEEKIAAQELSCKELKLEAGRAESSSDGGSKNLASSTAEGGHKPRDVVPNLKKGVDTPQVVQEYEVVPVMHRVPEKDWGTGTGSHIPTGGRDTLLTLAESDREKGSPLVDVLDIECRDIPEEYGLSVRDRQILSHQSQEGDIECFSKAELLGGWVKGTVVNTCEGQSDVIAGEHMSGPYFPELRQHQVECEFSDPRELTVEADFWVSTRESEEAFGGAPEGSGLGGSRPSEVGEDCSVPGRSQSLTCTVGPPFEGSPAVSEELGGMTVDSIPTVLVSGSTTPSEGVQKSRHRVERGWQTPVEDLESQGSALRAEPPRNDPGETVSGLGETQTLPDGQRSGDLRQPDSCVALGDGVSLVGGESAPQEVLACQAKIQPQGGDSGLDNRVQRLNFDLVGGRCTPQKVLECQAMVQPQGGDSGLDGQVQRLNSDLVGGRCASQKVLGCQAIAQPQGGDSGLANQVQRSNSDLVGGRCAPQKVLVYQAMVQPQGGDPGLENQAQRLNSDLVGGRCASLKVLACQAMVQPQGGDSGLDIQVQRLTSDLVGGRCAPQKALVYQAVVQPQDGDPRLENQVQRLNSDPVEGQCALQKVLACQAIVQPQSADSGLDNRVQRLNSDLVGGRCAPQKVLACQALVQPQGGDSGVDTQVQRLNSDLVGGRCASQEALLCQAIVQPQGVDSGLDDQVQRLNSDLVGGRCAPQKVLACQAIAQPQGGDPGLGNQAQRLNSDLVGGRCASQKVLVRQTIVQLQGGDSELNGPVQRLNSDLVEGQCALQEVLVCQAIVQLQGGDSELNGQVQRLNSDLVEGQCALQEVLACQAIVQLQRGDSELNGQVQRLNSDLVGGRWASQEVLVCQAVIQSEGTDPGLEDQVQGVPPDLEGGATDNSAPTMLSSEEATPSWRVLDPRREGRGREASPRALVQPEGTGPRLEGQLQVNSPALVEEWYRVTSVSTLTMLDSGGTAPGGRVQSPRGEDQVQAVIPDLVEGRVVKGCPAPGATAPHSPQPQWLESFERPGAWLSSLAAVSNHCGLLSGWTELSLGRGQVSHPRGRVGNTTVLVMVVLSCSWDTSVSKVRLGAAQMGSAGKEKGSPWVGLVGPESMDRGIQLESGRRRTGACPCCCGPGSLFCRLKQGSTSG
ncbi:hypothetical protein NDU88_006590 [Pleurodeles waltl]|uniref:Uncharacterized protein n=1 Tax=Pleurodeles waltl TaxID=8319 RepID=A0AAV7TXN5_PLEWA|nr:hypothetical protein NDU88_006590 [Pleurodeles waltl]